MRFVAGLNAQSMAESHSNLITSTATVGITDFRTYAYFVPIAIAYNPHIVVEISEAGVAKLVIRARLKIVFRKECGFESHPRQSEKSQLLFVP